MSLQDAYKKLRPVTENEICVCNSVESLLLVDLMSDNPIHCGSCRNEIDPERLPLTETEIYQIASWYDTARALYMLWINSGEYEAYAKEKLLDPNGQINVMGRGLAQKISEKIPTKFWYFSDADDGEPTICPVCKQPLNLNVKWGTGYCERCFIHI